MLEGNLSSMKVTGERGKSRKIRSRAVANANTGRKRPEELGITELEQLFH